MVPISTLIYTFLDKVGTTLVTDWDVEVSFITEPNKVEWAQSCGHQGKISPFGGTEANCSGKLIGQPTESTWWNVEGAGKITPPPVALEGYERSMRASFLDAHSFRHVLRGILVRGTKMSSSKSVWHFCSRVYPSVSSRNWSLLICITSLQPGNWFWPIRHGGSDLYDEYDLVNIFGSRLGATCDWQPPLLSSTN